MHIYILTFIYIRIQVGSNDPYQATVISIYTCISMYVNLQMDIHMLTYTVGSERLVSGYVGFYLYTEVYVYIDIF